MFIETLLSITSIHLLAAMSPGPDFIMASQQSLINGRRAGMLCSLGITLGLAVHIAYCAIGLAAIMSQSLALMTAIRWLGALYIIYIGSNALRSQPQPEGSSITLPNSEAISAKALIAKGFLCNILNPKATLYFLALFSLVLSPEMPIYQLFILSLWIMLIQFGWFAIVVFILSTPRLQKKFHAISHWIDRAMGVALIGFGFKLIFSKVS